MKSIQAGTGSFGNLTLQNGREQEDPAPATLMAQWRRDTLFRGRPGGGVSAKLISTDTANLSSWKVSLLSSARRSFREAT